MKTNICVAKSTYVTVVSIFIEQGMRYHLYKGHSINKGNIFMHIFIPSSPEFFP